MDLSILPLTGLSQLLFPALLSLVVADGDAFLVSPFSGHPWRPITAASSLHTLSLHDQNGSEDGESNGSSRRMFFCEAARRLTFLTVTTTSASVLTSPKEANAASPTTTTTTTPGALDSLPFTKPANPFVQLETVGMVPKVYFDENRSIYALTERILDGDTFRVRHVPGFSFTNQTPEPLQKRGIADDTLVIRLYGIDCPEIAKNKNQTTQPFANEAKQYTSDLIYRQMVKVTFIRRDRYGRAIAMVETLPSAGFLLSGVPGLGPKDLTLELAKAGLAELYTGGGAEYYVRDLSPIHLKQGSLVIAYHQPCLSLTIVPVIVFSCFFQTKKRDILEAIQEAKKEKRGIWSLGDNRVSAAEQKRILRNEAQDPAAVLAY